MQDKTSHCSTITRLICLATILGAQIIFSERVYPQQAVERPIALAGLVKSLQQHALRVRELIEEVNTRGVSFQISADVEKEIRRNGLYLGKVGLDKLLESIRKSYRPQQRLKLTLLRYAPCGEHYDEFAELLASKVKALPSELISRDDRLSYTAGLQLVKEEKSLESLSEENQYWANTQSLQLLQGICTSKGNDVYIISQVFLGDLHGALGSTIRIEFKVVPDEYGTIGDVHSLLILYSLATAAHVRGESNDLVIAYLSEALAIAKQIHTDPATVQSVRNAIELMLRELGASNLVLLPTQ